MADIDLTVTASVPANTSASIKVYEDTDNDGTAEATSTQALSDGTNTYTLSGFTGGDATGYDYWWELTTFSTTDLTATPTVSSVEIDTAPSTGDDLTAQDIETTSPSVESPSITQAHDLTAQDVDTGSPVVDSAAIAATDSLTAQDIETAAPSVDSPSITQVHDLTAQDIATASPTVDEASTIEPADLTAQNIVTGVPQIDGAVLTIPQPVTVRAYKSDSQYRTAPVLIIDSKRPLVVYRVKVENDALTVEEV